MVTDLVAAVQALGLEGEIALAGRWVRLQGERYRVYVVETIADGYYSWCDAPEERAVIGYPDPTEAIQDGLRRAARRPEGDGAIVRGNGSPDPAA